MTLEVLAGKVTADSGATMCLYSSLLLSPNPLKVIRKVKGKAVVQLITVKKYIIIVLEIRTYNLYFAHINYLFIIMIIIY